MIKDVQCPYFICERQGRTYCECADFRFPDKETRREIVYSFCAHPIHYQICPLKAAMDHYYERRFS